MKSWTEISPEKELIPFTRIHKTRLSHKLNTDVWLKREDESSFGISGPKMRKYASILPFIEENLFRKVVLMGGAYSNHLVSLPQLLISRGIETHLFMRGEKELKINGNQLWIRLLNKPQNLHWISRSDWANADEIIAEFAERHRSEGSSVLCIPEGGSMAAALPGACTLGQDIRRNEIDHALFFNHVFMDAGTGFSAIAALLDDYRIHPERHWHIVLMADTKENFLQKLDQMFTWYQCLHPGINTKPGNFTLYDPPAHLKFGKVNSEVLKETMDIARNHGVLSDPVYGTKLWMRVRQSIENNEVRGNILLIQSGGTSLTGFMDKLSTLLS